MRIWPFIVLVFLTVFCSSGDQKEYGQVRSVATGIIDADNQGDINRVVSYYHPAAILFPPGRPSIVGKEAIRKNYESIFASSTLQIQIEIEEVKIIGNWAFVSGKNKGQRTSLNDHQVYPIDDVFMMVLEKFEGDWKIRKLLWS